MAVFRNREKTLRDYLIGPDEAARAVCVSSYRLRQLVRDGFIKPAARKGHFRLGDVIDGYADAAKAGIVRVAPDTQGR